MVYSFLVVLALIQKPLKKKSHLFSKHFEPVSSSYIEILSVLL